MCTEGRHSLRNTSSSPLRLRSTATCTSPDAEMRGCPHSSAPSWTLACSPAPTPHLPDPTFAIPSSHPTRPSSDPSHEATSPARPDLAVGLLPSSPGLAAHGSARGLNPRPWRPPRSSTPSGNGPLCCRLPSPCPDAQPLRSISRDPIPRVCASKLPMPAAVSGPTTPSLRLRRRRELDTRGSGGIWWGSGSGGWRSHGIR
mmetsp:Transcript_23845/g.54274  ORF Transcript_23845/g.54274 Transcript_23845/m.54274 type:complete len:201 (-) Transcript_23845:62-664(-)